MEWRGRAKPSRQLQDHCQGEHQDEPDTSRARGGTCAGHREQVRARRRPAALSDGAWGEQGLTGPSGIWTLASGGMASDPARPPVPPEVTPSLPWACWAEVSLPGGHRGPPVGTRSWGLHEMGPVLGQEGWWPGSGAQIGEGSLNGPSRASCLCSQLPYGVVPHPRHGLIVDAAHVSFGSGS